MAAERIIIRPSMIIAPEVHEALQKRSPIVALESAVITHGLPFPTNLEVARQMESIVSQEGAQPATIAVIDGDIHVGLDAEQLQRLAQSSEARKISKRDLAMAATTHGTGGTTVAATLYAASTAGIQVFATGGIGGVHREDPRDVSADIPALAQTPILVVCAGAKSILDLRATLEQLETLSVPVIGLGTDQFPAFYSRTSGLGVGMRIDSAAEIARYWFAHRALGLQTAVLVGAPVPEESAIAESEVKTWIEEASRDARQQGIRGPALTPYLLSRLATLSNGRTIQANVALLQHNARVATQIARAVADVGTGARQQ